MSLRCCRAGVAAVVLTMSSIADARDPVAAEALFDEARAASAQGDYAKACDKLTESQRLDPAPGTLLNLGDCKERLGLVASAWQLFREAADLFASTHADEARVRFARQRASALEPRLAQLEIVLAAAAPSARVVRDGVELGGASLGATLPLDPGAHVVVVHAVGHKDARFEIRVAEGETKSLRVGVGPALEAPVAQPEGSAAPRAIGIALLGLSVAGIGVGAVTGGMTLDRKATVAESCHDQLCNPAGVDAASQGRSLATVSTVTFIGGAACLALGAYLTIRGPRWAGAPPLTVQPAAGPAAAAVRVGGAF